MLLFLECTTFIFHVSYNLYCLEQQRSFLIKISYYTVLKMKAETSRTSKLTVQFVKTSKSKEYILAEGHVDSQEKYGWFPVHVQATVALKSEDRVHVQLVEGALHESGSEQHLITGFGGFLVGLD